MRNISLALLAAALGLISGRAAAQERVDSPRTQSAAAAIAQDAKASLSPIVDDGEPGDVTDEEASRPATKVSEGVYRSSRLNAASADRLYELGIRTVLNLEDRGHFNEERKILDAAQARRAAAGKSAWRIASINDHMSGIFPPSASQIDGALAVLAAAFLRPVLVHCKHGEDRTGVAVASFRVDVEKRMSVEEAFQEAKSFNCCHLVMPGNSLRRFLKDYRWPR